MKNSPKKTGRDQGSSVPPRTDKRDPSQPPVRREQPQGHNNVPNKRGQEPRREDELPLKEDRQPVARDTQRQTTVPRAKGQSTVAQKNKPSRNLDDDDEYDPKEEEMDDVDLSDEDADDE